jgi:drug/metabolite transporter (DMT)-like permease
MTQPNPSRQPDAVDWTVLIALGAMWGCSFFFIKKSVAVFTPLQMSSLRMVLAWLIYIPVAIAVWSKIDWSRWRYLVGVAMFGSAIPNLLFAIAQQHVSSGLAGTLNSLTPLFTLIIGSAIFKTPLSTNKILGVLLGLVGTVLLITINGKGGFNGNIFFAGVCVLATVCYAINALLVNQYLRDQPAGGIAAAAFLLVGPLFLLAVWQSDGFTAIQEQPGAWTALGYILYLATFGTVIGSIVYFWLLKRTNAIFATSVTYLLPIVALLLGTFAGESIGWLDFVGAAIILAGVYLARK